MYVCMYARNSDGVRVCVSHVLHMHCICKMPATITTTSTANQTRTTGSLTAGQRICSCRQRQRQRRRRRQQRQRLHNFQPAILHNTPHLRTLSPSLSPSVTAAACVSTCASPSAQSSIVRVHCSLGSCCSHTNVSLPFCCSWRAMRWHIQRACV